MSINSYTIKEFKPCPFCGRIWMSLGSYPENRFAVQCLCGATGPREVSRERAIKTWNLRDQHLFWNPFRLSIRFPDSTNTVDFKGRLESLDLATLLQMLSSKEKTGILQLSKGYAKSAICLKNGNIIAASDSTGFRLGQILLNSGMISPYRLKEALKTAKHTGKMFGEALLSLNFIDAKTLREIIHQQVQEAVLELFFWKEGHFEYRDCIIEFDERSINEINSLEIIMESARRMDEWNEIKQRKKESSASREKSESKPVAFRLKSPN